MTLSSLTKTQKKVLRLLVATLKGGTAKTTTAILLGLAMARKGYKVVAICADTRSQGMSDWRNLMAENGDESPVVILTWRGEDLDGKLSRFAKDAEVKYDADVVIIDTGGEHPEVFMSAAMYANQLISPVQPLIADMRRLPATEDAAAEIAGTGHPIVMSVLFNRVNRVGRGAAAGAREFVDGTLREQELAETGESSSLNIHVLTTEVPRDASTYADVWGTCPDDLGVYTQLADEIEMAWKEQEVA